MATATITLKIFSDGKQKVINLSASNPTVSSVTANLTPLVEGTDYTLVDGTVVLTEAKPFGTAIRVTFTSDLHNKVIDVSPEQVDYLYSDDDNASPANPMYLAIKADTNAARDNIKANDDANKNTLNASIADSLSQILARVNARGIQKGHVAAFYVDHLNPLNANYSAVSGLEIYKNGLSWENPSVMVVAASTAYSSPVGYNKTSHSVISTTNQAGTSSSVASLNKFNTDLYTFGTVTVSPAITGFSKIGYLGNTVYVMGNGTATGINVMYSIDDTTGTRTTLSNNSSIPIVGAATFSRKLIEDKLYIMGGDTSKSMTPTLTYYGITTIAGVSSDRNIKAYDPVSNTLSTVFVNILPVKMFFGTSNLAFNNVTEVSDGKYLLVPPLIAADADANWSINSTGRMWLLDILAGTCVELSDTFGTMNVDICRHGYYGPNKAITLDGRVVDVTASAGTMISATLTMSGLPTGKFYGLQSNLVNDLFIPVYGTVSGHYIKPSTTFIPGQFGSGKLVVAISTASN